jgi:hypothetical protein
MVVSRILHQRKESSKSGDQGQRPMFQITQHIADWILLESIAKFMLLYITVTYMMVEATRQRELALI